MAFTLITSGIQLAEDTLATGVASYFHPKDIEILLNQDGAEAVALATANVNDTVCTVLVAVKNYKNINGGVEYQRLATEGIHFIGLPCPPYNDAGGIFEPVPKPGGDLVNLVNI